MPHILCDLPRASTLKPPTIDRYRALLKHPLVARKVMLRMRLSYYDIIDSHLSEFLSARIDVEMPRVRSREKERVRGAWGKDEECPVSVSVVDLLLGASGIDLFHQSKVRQILRAV